MLTAAVFLGEDRPAFGTRRGYGIGSAGQGT